MNRSDHREAKPRTTLLGLALCTVTLLLSPGCFVEDACMTDDGASCSDVNCEAGDELCSDALEGAVVENWMAVPGDVTTSPYSGLKFVVERHSSRVSYKGHSFVFDCSGKCIELVVANRGLYLDDFVSEAGGPTSDPDESQGGAIEDHDAQD